MRAYFDANPAAMDKYLWINPRTVFFTERPGGPFGKLNVQVTPFATIATDKSVYPRAMPAFLNVPSPRDGSRQRRPSAASCSTRTPAAPSAPPAAPTSTWASARGAEELAGRQLSEGELYYLAVK